MSEPKVSVKNQALLEHLAKGLWEAWQKHELDMKAITNRGRSLLQNIGHPQMVLTKKDVIEYVKDMKALNDELHRGTRDLAKLTINYTLENLIEKE